jgi:hypothetical protein
MSSDDQEPKPSNRIPPVKSDEAFARLVWSEDVDDGIVKNEALSRQDLMGGGVRGLSMDRHLLISRGPIEYIVSRQQGSHPSQSALLSRIDHRDIDAVLEDDARTLACKVVADPITANGEQPENPAHCQLHSIKKRTKGQANQLRAMLVPKFQRAMSVEDYFNLLAGTGNRNPD